MTGQYFLRPDLERPKVRYPQISGDVSGDPVYTGNTTFRPQANPSSWLVMDPSDVDGGLRKFIIGTYAEANLTEDFPLQTYTLGVNVNPNVGQQIDIAQPNAFIRWELQWEDAQGGIHDEWHFIFGEKTSGDQVRWLSAQVLDNDVATVEAAFSVNLLRMYAADGSTERFRYNWTAGNTAMKFAIPAATPYEIMGNGDIDGATGILSFRPHSAAGKTMEFEFGGGSGELFFIQSVGSGSAPDRLSIGTGHNGGDEGYFAIRGFAGGMAFGLGADPGGSATPGDVYFKDGAKLRASGTTTGLTILGGASDKLGFHGATPVAKQTVTGAHGSNAALQSLLTALDALGLIVDGSE